ncbi:MAG: iron-containing alcohol dehydrogenase [Thermoplasmata archaeon]|nr:iron-containing alcohol dehydrogenase [Thermoplasmata archaeon]
MSGFFLSPRIAWGTGALEQLSGLGFRRALVLVDPTVAGAGGERRLVEELAKSDTAIQLEVLSEAPHRAAAVEELLDRARSAPPDAVVALGGGRTIDAGKAVRLRLGHPETALSNVPQWLDPPTGSGPGLVAVPTTSGSGAEASWVADLVDADGAPFEIADRSLVPDWAMVDPALASALPVDRVLDGAAEALATASEAFLSAWANPFSDALALDAVTTVVQRLPHAIRWSDDPDARAALHYAATSAGLAASNAQRGLAHALARALERPTGLAYGRLVGIALPAVLEFDHPSARERLETLGHRVPTRDENASMPFAQRVRRLFDQLHFPGTVRAAGVALDRWTELRTEAVAHTVRSPAVLANPRVPSAAEVGHLLDALVGP